MSVQKKQIFNDIAPFLTELFNQSLGAFRQRSKRRSSHQSYQTAARSRRCGGQIISI